MGVLSAKNIALDFDAEMTKKIPDLSIEQRKNLYLIFKEAINNIAKHSKATKSRVELGIVNDEFRMVITDNGVGFNTVQVYEGNGLANFVARAEASEMIVNVSSEIGKGTKIELVIGW
jgi:signal transduction histidine kinase